MRRLYIVLLLMLLAACNGSPDETLVLPTQAMIPGQARPLPPQAELRALPVQPLIFWTPTSGTLDSVDDLDVWQFSGEQDDIISLRVIGQVTVPTMTLLNPVGDVLEQGVTIEYTLPAAGVYRVVVQLADVGSGDYDIGLAYADRDAPFATSATPLPQVVGVPTPTPAYADLGRYIGQIEPGEVIGGSFSDDDEGHVYTFDGVAGQIVTIEMIPNDPDVDPFLTLFNPAGDPMAMDDNSAGSRGAILRRVILPANGLYTIQARSDAEQGGYSIGLLRDIEAEQATPTPTRIPGLLPTPTSFIPLTPTLAPAVSENRLEDHVPVRGTLERGSDFARFPIIASENEIVTIGVSAVDSPTFRPKLELYGPEGDLIASASSSLDATGTAIIAAQRLPLSGPYVVFVLSEDGSTGDYIISYGRGASRQDVLRGTVEPNVPAMGDIAAPGVRDVWALYFNAGDVITAAVTPTSAGLDPLLEIATVDGELIGIDDNGGGGRNALIGQVNIPETGVYYIRVLDNSGSRTGTYTLVWRFITLAPTSTPIPNTTVLMTVDDEAPDNAYVFYPFQGQAGQRVEIRVNAILGSDLDPVVALIAPDGTVIDEADDTNGSLNPILIAELPQDGTYQVRVNGYLSSGLFELIVTLLY